MPGRVAEGYLAFADHLARAGRGNEAIRELEEAIEVLPAGFSHDRLVLAPGALHARLGRSRVQGEQLEDSGHDGPMATS